MEEIVTFVSWDKIKKAITKLENDKSPELNGVSNNTSKALNDKNCACLILFYNQFWQGQAGSTSDTSAR